MKMTGATETSGNNVIRWLAAEGFVSTDICEETQYRLVKKQ
jgi:hypothetical protein